MPDRKIRYAVVGAGWISQAAFMPGVRQTGNSELTALVTGDHRKAEALGRRYRIERIYHQDAYLAALDSRGFDAVYIAMPNWAHLEYALPALERGLHVLLEKPMATSEADCRTLIDAARRGRAKLMIAYRLHFEPASLEVLRIAHSGGLGRVALFNSSFSQHVELANHRAQSGVWAGPVADLAPYPVNAARNLFRAEPTQVTAWGTEALGLGFHDAVSVQLRFPEERLAQFSVAYGLEGVNEYRLTGDEGSLRVNPAFALDAGFRLEQSNGGSISATEFRQVDQFSGETAYFSDCILNDIDPEPDGEEGWLDVRVLAAIEEALRSGRPQALTPTYRSKRPLPDQRFDFPPTPVPDLVHAAPPMG
jgi:predicted dehydrogenase